MFQLSQAVASVADLLTILDGNPDAAVEIRLPQGELIPAHFHLTEVGRVEKHFIDCGGTRRNVVSCLLQIWVADDVQHRLPAKKFAKILRLADPCSLLSICLWNWNTGKTLPVSTE